MDHATNTTVDIASGLASALASALALASDKNQFTNFINMDLNSKYFETYMNIAGIDIIG